MELGPRSPFEATDRWPAKAPPRAGLVGHARPWLVGLAAALALALAVTAALTIGRPGANGSSRATRSFTRTQALPRPAGTARLPLSAQAQVSGALAAGKPAFRAIRSSGGFRAENPTQGVSVRFDADGVAVTSGALSLRMHLQGLGFGDASSLLADSSPTARANRVSYTRAGVSEWYRNGPQGLEQGFTVARPPASAEGGPLTLTLALSGDARPALAADAQSVVLRHGSAALTYGALVANDASGRTLHGRLALRPGRLLLRIDTVGARYPLTIDPLIQKGEKLSGGGAEARFGTSAALSADGSTLLVGAPQANGSQGAAWVFDRSGSTWQQQGELTSPPAVAKPEVEECAEESAEETGECAFGASVALSGDGDTALVGEPSPGATPGSAWIFTRSDPGSPWTREAEPLKAGSDPHEGRFGKSVALSADGTLALVGDPSGVSGRGGAWVFVHAGKWTAQSTILDAEASSFAHFGRSVALSADGATAVIGGSGDANGSGAAWAFTRSGAVWTQQGRKLTGDGETGEGHFGRSVALSADGSTTLVAAPYDSEGRGAVWTFSRSGSTFVRSGSEQPGPAEAHGHFGASLALSGDGATALVGAPRVENGLGIVDVFERSGSTWIEQASLGGSGAVGKGNSGASVALSSDGLVAAIGASRDDRRVGAAWVFSSEPASAISAPTVTNVEPGHGPVDGGTEVTIQGSNFTKDPSREPVVMFGGEPATGVEVRTAAEIRAVSPRADAKGLVHVTVATGTGTSAETEEDTFRYDGAATGGGDPSSPSSSAAGGSIGVLGTAQSAPAACRVTLRSKHLVVAFKHSAAVRLMRTGGGQCRGTLTLRYRQRTKGKHFRLRPIGSAHFSMAPGASQVVRIRLNRLGRKLFLAGHGRLNASAAVLRTTPTPRQAKTASVRLSVKKAPKPAAVAR
jgi:IPT/TIG domain/FG-GAP repeat